MKIFVANCNIQIIVVTSSWRNTCIFDFVLTCTIHLTNDVNNARRNAVRNLVYLTSELQLVDKTYVNTAYEQVSLLPECLRMDVRIFFTLLRVNYNFL